MGGAEVDEEEAAGGAEVGDAAVHGEVAVVVEDNLAGDSEEFEGGVGEGLVFVPEGLAGGEVVAEEDLEVRVVEEVVATAVGGWSGVGGEP